MKISNLLRFLLSYLNPGIVEAGNGGGASSTEAEDDDTLVIDPPEGAAGEGGNDNGSSGDDGARAGEGGVQGNGDTEADDEIIVSIGDETPTAEEEDPARAPAWVRELRKSNREKDRRIRELEAKVGNQAGGTAQPAALGPKPTLQGCDYDEDKFEAELEAWHSRKREQDDLQTKQRRIEEEQKQAWQSKLDGYTKGAKELKVQDFEDAEATAQETLNVTQQGIIINGADNPALLIYALGKNPKKAKELGSIADPVKFAFAVAKLEKDLKVTPRKAAPAPERVIRGGSPGASAVDSQLERLRADAEKTGDYSKVHKYRQQQRSKST